MRSIIVSSLHSSINNGITIALRAIARCERLRENFYYNLYHLFIAILSRISNPRKSMPMEMSLSNSENISQLDKTEGNRKNQLLQHVTK
jgi:hypothetical protein